MHRTKGYRLVGQITAATFVRVLLNTARRFAYPFAPELSRGLGVSLTSITSLIAINHATSILGLFLGPFADRFGYRPMMLAGLLLFVIGMLAAGFFPLYGVVLIAFFLAGLGKSVFDPALQAYVGERVPFQRRGLVIGLLEFSWAGSTLLGIPLMAVLIDRFDWRAPFFTLGGLGILGVVVLNFFMIRSRNGLYPAQKRIRIASAWISLIKKRIALGALGFAFCASVANDNLFVIYGAWLEKDFQLSILALGFGTIAIGMAELAGETLTASISDRIGLKRAVVLGMLVTIISYGLLPLIGKTLPLALAGLFMIFIGFEFTIVTALSLCTEFVPGLRATMMACFFAAAGIGRVTGAMLGGPLWILGGIHLTGMFSAVFTILALVFMVWGLKGWKPIG